MALHPAVAGVRAVIGEAERLLTGQRRALELAVGGAPLPEVLEALVLAVEERFERRLLASILLVDRDGRSLRLVAAPSLPTGYSRAVDGLAIDASAGTCGAAAHRWQTVVTPDIARDPAWKPHRDVALAHGLQSCWSTPILSSSGDVLGTFAIYARTVGEPSPAERDSLDLVARTAALVIERDRAQARDRFLLALDDAVRPLIEADAITATAARELGRHLQVQRCAYATVEADEDTFELIGNYTDGVGDIVGWYTFTAFGAACAEAMRAGRPYVVADSEDDPRIGAAVVDAYRSTAIRAVICVPVLKSGRFVAAMAVHAGAPRIWRADEVELVQQVASRCWESIERARLTRTLHHAFARESEARAEADELKQRAEAANRAKDEFLAMLGHELRNPLSPIRTALHLIGLKGGDALSRELSVIERQVTHLTRLVDDLLDVSRIVRGMVELRVEEIAAADVVARAVELVSPLIEARGHHLEVTVADPHLTVQADPTRLSQVLGNLLSNAAKYTEPHGRIAVRVSADRDHVRWVVGDTGIGIPPDALAQVFELFTQGRQTSDRASGGLGLGLAIARSLVERHGGRLLARSEGPGRGSEFEVVLPRRCMAPSATTARDSNATVAQQAPIRRVLVVDDNEDGAAMLAAVLTARGHHVRVAHDALSALEIACSFSPEFALLDIGLPVIDGHELAVRLRNLEGLPPLTLVAVTGYGQAIDKARARAAGFDHHLVKPVDLEAIARVLR